MIPNDPFMLLSFINMKLRDEYDSFESLCDNMDVDSNEIKDKLKHIYVFLLMWQYRVVKNLSQLLDGIGTLGGGYRAHHELSEGIVCRDVIVDGIVEHGTDISEVDAPGVLRRLVLHEERVELRQPVLVDFIKGKGGNLAVILLEPLVGLVVDFPCALLLARVHVALEASKEQATIAGLGVELFEDSVLDLYGSLLDEFPVRGHSEQEVVNLLLLRLNVGIERSLVGIVLDATVFPVPLAGQDANVEGNESGHPMLGYPHLQRRGFAMLDGPGVEIKFRRCHVICTFFAR